MSLFNKVKTARTEKQEDRVGGFVVHPTNVYDAEVIRMYGIKSDKGALGVVLELNLFLDPDSDATVRHTETIYVTNQDGENFYTSTKDQKRYMNSGWLLADAVALFATDLEAGLGELETDEFHYKRKGKDGKEINVQTECYPEVEGVMLKVALVRVIKPKRQQVNDTWVDIEGETVETNEIERIFNEDGFTLLEFEAEKDEPEFIDAWIKKRANKDKVIKAKVAEKSKRTAGSRADNARKAPAKTGRTPRFTPPR